MAGLDRVYIYLNKLSYKALSDGLLINGNARRTLYNGCCNIEFVSIKHDLIKSTKTLTSCHVEAAPKEMRTEPSTPSTCSSENPSSRTQGVNSFIRPACRLSAPWIWFNTLLVSGCAVSSSNAQNRPLLQTCWIMVSCRIFKKRALAPGLQNVPYRIWIPWIFARRTIVDSGITEPSEERRLKFSIGPCLVRSPTEFGSWMWKWHTGVPLPWTNDLSRVSALKVSSQVRWPMTGNDP